MEKRMRRKYLVNKSAQFRYIRLVVIPSLVLSAAIYCFIYYAVFKQMLIPEAIATTLLPAMKKVNIGLIIAAPVLLSIIIRKALLYSHRIVGPIPRLERELDKVIQGDYSVRIKTRNNDELRGLVNKMNSVLESVDKSFVEAKK